MHIDLARGLKSDVNESGVVVLRIVAKMGAIERLKERRDTE